MALSPGSRLGPYEILAAIGAGGMGAVYRATDTGLGRQVAIKVLPDTFAQDAERLARFEREAKTLAALNHPNIAAIYGFERSSGTQALVMELVEGEDLSQRIERGAIPIGEALLIARQIAEALEAAHEQGIIHRDLKPANIKVREDDTVKVLDFGLAKAMETPGASATVNVSQLATITTPAMTQAGVILGTAAYMSPEQARGKPVDRRTDTWALGCVLYEMLSGHRAFGGETVTDVLSAVLQVEPDWSRLPHTTPAVLTTLIRRCLRKDARQRLGDAGAIRVELDDAAAALGRSADAPAIAPVSRATRQVSLAAALAVAAVTAVLAATAGYWWQGRGLPRTSGAFARVAIPIPSGTELTAGASVALSPDGGTLAFVAARDGISELYLRRLAEPDAHVVRDTRGATAPFFSPDSEWVAFIADGRLKKVSTRTGVMTSVTDSLLDGVVTGTADWGSDNRIVAIDRGATLAVIPAGGGQAQRVSLKSTPDRAAIRSVSWLPGGTAALVGVSLPNSPTGDTSVMIVSLDRGETRTVVERGASPRYLQTGHLVFVQDGILKAVSFNPSTLEIGGAPIDVLPGVRQQTFNMHAIFSCSEAGSCAYIAGGTAKSRTILSVDRTGTARPLGVPPNSYSHPRFSPSGDRLAWWVEQLECEIETYDVARGTTVRMKPTDDSHFPTWTPDGRAISFVGRRGASGYSIYAIAADGSGTARALTPASEMLTPITPFSWTPQGALVFADKGDLWVVDGVETEPRVLEETAGNETTPAVSPDGRWLAYASDNAGRLDVYVRPFPGGGERYVISSSGGSEPVWARNGRELFFRSGDRFMVVDIGGGPKFTASRPRLMFTIRTQASPGRTGYDVSPDGQTFVMTDAGEEERAAQQVMLLQNWFGELTRLAPGAAGSSN